MKIKFDYLIKEKKTNFTDETIKETPAINQRIEKNNI